MTYGFQALSSAGFVQIDEGFQNYRVIQTGSGNTNSPISFPSVPDGPIIMIRNLGNNFLHLHSLWATGFHLNGQNWPYENGGPYLFDYVVLGPQKGAVSAETFGLRVYDAAGLAVFDSGHGYLSIDGVNGPITAQFNFARTFTHATPLRGFRYFMVNACFFLGDTDESQNAGMYIGGKVASQTSTQYNLSISLAQALYLGYAYVYNETTAMTGYY